MKNNITTINYILAINLIMLIHITDVFVFIINPTNLFLNRRIFHESEYELYYELWISRVGSNQENNEPYAMLVLHTREIYLHVGTIASETIIISSNLETSEIRIVWWDHFCSNHSHSLIIINTSIRGTTLIINLPTNKYSLKPA